MQRGANVEERQGSNVGPMLVHLLHGSLCNEDFALLGKNHTSFW